MYVIVCAKRRACQGQGNKDRKHKKPGQTSNNNKLNECRPRKRKGVRHTNDTESPVRGHRVLSTNYQRNELPPLSNRVRGPARKIVSVDPQPQSANESNVTAPNGRPTARRLSTLNRLRAGIDFGKPFEPGTGGNKECAGQKPMFALPTLKLEGF